MTRLILFGPAHDGGRRVAVQLVILGHGFSWMTKGEPGCSGYSWPGEGVRLI